MSSSAPHWYSAGPGREGGRERGGRGEREKGRERGERKGERGRGERKIKKDSRVHV